MSVIACKQQFTSGFPVARTLCGQMSSGEPIRRYNVVMSAAHGSLNYVGVETALASGIFDGDLRVDDQLPTEDSVIARFGAAALAF